MGAELDSAGIEDIQVTPSGDYIVVCRGKEYPVRKELLNKKELMYLGYLVAMKKIEIEEGDATDGSRIAYIYHNAEAANEHV